VPVDGPPAATSTPTGFMTIKRWSTTSSSTTTRLNLAPACVRPSTAPC